MPDLDLEPSKRQFWDQRTRRWQTRLPRKFARNYAIFCLIVLGVLFWYRRELGSIEVTFGIVAVFAFGAGVMMANWLFDLY